MSASTISSQGASGETLGDDGSGRIEQVGSTLVFFPGTEGTGDDNNTAVDAGTGGEIGVEEDYCLLYQVQVD